MEIGIVLPDVAHREGEQRLAGDLVEVRIGRDRKGERRAAGPRGLEAALAPGAEHRLARSAVAHPVKIAAVGLQGSGRIRRLKLHLKRRPGQVGRGGRLARVGPGSSAVFHVEFDVLVGLEIEHHTSVRRNAEKFRRRKPERRGRVGDFVIPQRGGDHVRRRRRGRRRPRVAGGGDAVADGCARRLDGDRGAEHAITRRTVAIQTVIPHGQRHRRGPGAHRVAQSQSAHYATRIRLAFCGHENFVRVIGCRRSGREFGDRETRWGWQRRHHIELHQRCAGGVAHTTDHGRVRTRRQRYQHRRVPAASGQHKRPHRRRDPSDFRRIAGSRPIVVGRDDRRTAEQRDGRIRQCARHAKGPQRRTNRAHQQSQSPGAADDKAWDQHTVAGANKRPG